MHNVVQDEKNVSIIEIFYSAPHATRLGGVLHYGRSSRGGVFQYGRPSRDSVFQYGRSSRGYYVTCDANRKKSLLRIKYRIKFVKIPQIILYCSIMYNKFKLKTDFL